MDREFDKVVLERRFFKVLEDGSSEFEWILKEMGVPEDKWVDIEDIEINGAITQYNVNA